MKQSQEKARPPQEDGRAAWCRKIIPNGEMECIWASAGVIPYKLCDSAFDCSECAFDLVMRGAYEPSGQQTNLRGCRYTPFLFYHHGHTWAMVEQNANVRIGIDDLGQRLLGRIQGVSLPSQNELLSRESSILGRRSGIRLKGRGITISLVPPVEGYVIQTNEKLLLEPSLINLSPYGGGWLALLQPIRLAKNLRQLLYGPAALNWFDEETVKLYHIFADEFDMARPELGITFQDGGVLHFDLLDKIPAVQTRAILGQFFAPVSRFRI